MATPRIATYDIEVHGEFIMNNVTVFSAIVTIMVMLCTMVVLYVQRSRHKSTGRITLVDISGNGLTHLSLLSGLEPERLDASDNSLDTEALEDFIDSINPDTTDSQWIDLRKNPGCVAVAKTRQGKINECREAGIELYIL